MLLDIPGSDVAQTVAMERRFRFPHKIFLDEKGGPDYGSAPQAASRAAGSILIAMVLRIARLPRHASTGRETLHQVGAAHRRTRAVGSGRHHHSRRGGGADAIAMQQRFCVRRFSQTGGRDEAVALRMPLRWEPLPAIQKARGCDAPLRREAQIRRERRKDEVVSL